MARKIWQVLLSNSSRVHKRNGSYIDVDWGTSHYSADVFDFQDQHICRATKHQLIDIRLYYHPSGMWAGLKLCRALWCSAHSPLWYIQEISRSIRFDTGHKISLFIKMKLELIWAKRFLHFWCLIKTCPPAITELRISRRCISVMERVVRCAKIIGKREGTLVNLYERSSRRLWAAPPVSVPF